MSTDVLASGEPRPTTRSVVVGLGNPGAAYRDTRHNLGFRVVDLLHGRFRAEPWREECSARVATGARADLVQPQTFMNRSGFATRCLVERYGYSPDRILVVYDDVALPLGTLRLRPGGSPGGHRGLASVIESLRTDRVPRLRLGVAPEPTAAAPQDLAEFVLREFAPDELEIVERMLARAADAVEAWLERGIDAAMNVFNGPLPSLGADRCPPDAPSGGGAAR